MNVWMTGNRGPYMRAGKLVQENPLDHQPVRWADKPARALYVGFRRVLMTLFDDDRPRKPSKPVPGEDISLLSIEELQERIAIYRAEIERVERDIEAKRRSKEAADAFFRL